MASALQDEVLISTGSSDNEFSLKLFASPATDEVLVAAAKSGDHPAFGELWERHSNTAFNTAYRFTRNTAEAEDVVQEAWMKAFAHLRTFDGRAKFSTWLTRIVINSALMSLRRKRAHPEEETREPWEVADPINNVEELFTKRERAALLRQVICSLRPSLRMVVEIKQLSDRGSLKETADLAGISVAATKSRLLRARTKLRIALG